MPFTINEQHKLWWLLFICRSSAGERRHACGGVTPTLTSAESTRLHYRSCLRDQLIFLFVLPHSLCTRSRKIPTCAFHPAWDRLKDDADWPTWDPYLKARPDPSLRVANSRPRAPRLRRYAVAFRSAIAALVFDRTITRKTWAALEAATWRPVAG